MVKKAGKSAPKGMHMMRDEDMDKMMKAKKMPPKKMPPKKMPMKKQY